MTERLDAMKRRNIENMLIRLAEKYQLAYNNLERKDYDDRAERLITDLSKTNEEKVEFNEFYKTKRDQWGYFAR